MPCIKNLPICEDSRSRTSEADKEEFAAVVADIVAGSDAANDFGSDGRAHSWRLDWTADIVEAPPPLLPRPNAPIFPFLGQGLVFLVEGRALFFSESSTRAAAGQKFVLCKPCASSVWHCSCWVPCFWCCCSLRIDVSFPDMFIGACEFPAMFIGACDCSAPPLSQLVGLLKKRLIEAADAAGRSAKSPAERARRVHGYSRPAAATLPANARACHKKFSFG